MGDADGTTRTKVAAGGRLLIAMAVSGVCLALTGWSVLDVQARSAASLRDRSEALEDTAQLVNRFHAIGQARMDGEIERLRTELRAQALWAHPAGDAAQPGETGSLGEAPPVVTRRLDGLLRRSLTEASTWRALELIVTGPEGLQVIGFERGEERVLKKAWDAKHREGIAKALWYTDVVRRAVESSGRRVERGDVNFEGPSFSEEGQASERPSGNLERAVLRAAIGLHEPGELVQGVLVVSLDLAGSAAELALLARAGQQINLVSPTGRALDPAVSPEQANRFEALAERIFSAEVLPEAFEADGLLVLGRPLAGPEGETANLLALVETGSVSRGFPAWWATSWPGILGIVALLAGLSIALLYSEWPRPSPVEQKPLRPRVRDADPEANEPGIVLESARFSIRECLADVRGCLEREAATRGLSLDLRVERTLPDEAQGDAGWLGGLVVAMGREALDATAEDRVNLRVLEDAADVLRIEIDAGKVDLAPVAGMRAVARSLGGRIESASRGRLVLVVPSGLAWPPSRQNV